MAATHLRSVSQNFPGSGFLISSMLRIAKNHSYSSSCHVFPPNVKQSGLMLLILMCGDVAMNPGPVMLGSVNARSIGNKGPLLADAIVSHAFDFLCLTETHIRTTDSDSFLHFLTPDGFSLIHRPHSSGIGGTVGFFIRVGFFNIARWIPQIIAPLKILSHQSQFHDKLCSYLLSTTLLGRVFFDEFMSFVCFCLLLIAITSYVVFLIYTLMYLVLIVTNPFRIM